MSSWLKESSGEASRKVLRPEVEAMLPPSVRQPEVNRFTPLGSDAPDDVDDEDIGFLVSLADEVDRAAAAPSGAAATTAAAATPLRGASPRIDDMRVFREMKSEDAGPLRFDFKLRDVDMGDLLEELSTVRAALRQRKAA